MSQQELLKRVVATLDALAIDYMLAGSTVSSIQGRPRSTHDIDLVVDVRKENVDELLLAFPPPQFYLSEPAVRDAISRGSMFNLLENTTGDKADFWVLSNSAFDVSQFARKQTIRAFGLDVNISTAEDTILAKLRWDRACGGSERQYTDALEVYRVQRHLLDRNYLDDWAAKLHVTARWQQLLTDAEAP